MHLINLIKKTKGNLNYIKLEKWFFIIFFVVVFLITRLPYLSKDTVNPDSVNWHTRSEQFINGLKYFQLDKTYQHYQPGVTLMWLMGPTIEIVRRLSLDGAVYNEFTFPIYDYVAKIVVVFSQLILSISAMYLFANFFKLRKAFFVVLLFTLEPFFIGNSRLVHLDILMSLLLLNGLILSYWVIKKFNLTRLVIASILFALAFLTKSIGVGGFLYASFVGALLIFLTEIKNDPKNTQLIKISLNKALKYLVLFLFFSFIFIFIFWPALWVNFTEVMGYLYYGAFRVGLAKGHNQIFLEGKTRDAGWLFYPVVMLYKTSIFTSFGVLLNLLLVSPRNLFNKLKHLFTPIRNFKVSASKIIPNVVRIADSFTLEQYLFVFYVGYFVVMSISSKKIDRYAVVMFPMLSILAINGYFKYLMLFKSRMLNLVSTIFVLGLFTYGLIIPSFTFFPYYFTYTNPLLGTPQYVHENILAQKPFGIGMYAVKDLIVEKYGSTRDIALIDPKPMMSIYNKDHVYYVDVVGTRVFDTLILGVNEKMPGKVTKGKFEFIKSDSIYINGLEYWRIYVRGNEKIKTP
ncbi:hypothetical protein HYV31_04005 [candidate division WWE3 bacterium]|nr:hypothetical protein [candidate division WWE3 bacterium]